MSSLPPPPTRSPVVDDNGSITAPWIAWLTQLYQRVGGGSSATASDISEELSYIDVGQGFRIGMDESLLLPESRRQEQETDYLPAVFQPFNPDNLINNYEVQNPNYLLGQPNTWKKNQIVRGSVQAAFTSSDGSAGASGTFTTADAKTVTVKDGVITSIV